MVANVSATSASHAAQTAALSSATDNMFAKLNAERFAAIKALWSTALVCILLIPIVIGPLAATILLMIDHPGLPAAVREFGRDTIGDRLMHVFFGCLAWLVVGLHLLGRLFVRRGRQPVWNYIRNFKSVVLNHVCQVHFPGMSYDPKGFIGYKEFEATKLFAYASDDYRSEDYFTGQVGKTDISFAEVVAKRERINYGNDHSRTYLEEFFHGLMFVADFHKHFHSTTRLVPRAEKLAKVRGQKPVVLEDPDFEDTFVTVSTDQVDARYVLSTSMVRRFVDLNHRFPGMRALFKDERLILTLPTYRDKFEPSLYLSAHSSWQLDEFVADIHGLLKIVEELNLNTRIWSKQ